MTLEMLFAHSLIAACVICWLIALWIERNGR